MKHYSRSGARKRINWFSLLRKVIASTVALAVALFAWRVIDVRCQQLALQTKLDAFSSAGKVIDAAGVKRLHAARSSDELTEAWRAVFAELSDPDLRMAAATLPIIGSMEGEANEIPRRGQFWERDIEARKFLSDTKGVRDRLRKLAVKSRAVYFPMQYEGMDRGGSEAHGGIQFACKLLFFEALAALRYNAPAAAVEDVRCLLVLPRTLEGEPSMMSMAVSGGAEVAALRIVKIAVERRSLPQTQLTQLLEVLRAYQPLSERFQLAVQGECGMLQSALDSFAEKQGAMYFVLGAPRFRTATLDLLDRLEAAPMDDIDGLLKVGREVQTEIEELGFGNQSSGDVTAPTGLIPLTARTSTMVSNEMARRMAVVAIAIQLYRAKSGKFPTEISELEKLGVDVSKLRPVGGKPFGFRVCEDGRRGTLWGFSLLSKLSQTPDEPPEVDDLLGLNAAWVWQL